MRSDERIRSLSERLATQRRKLDDLLRATQPLLAKIPEINRSAELRDRFASERLDFSSAAKEREAAQEEWQRLNREIEELWRGFQATEPAVWAFAAELKQTLASIPLRDPLIALRAEIERIGFPSSVFPGARLLWQKSFQDLELVRARLAEMADIIGATAFESVTVPEAPSDSPPSVVGGYPELLDILKERIRTARIKASLSVNKELILLYWEIGQDILKRQRAEGWGTKVIDELARDLRRDFPDVSGLSARNLKYMRAFAEAWTDRAIVQATLAQIPWYHNIALMEKLKAFDERLWYALQAFEHGWSRNVLVHQIESGLYDRQGKAVTNFHRTLPAPQSDLANQLIKDPYNFEFLGLGAEMQERDLEKGLLENLRDFILELGKGFAFVGRQYPLEVGNRDYRLDLVFYHLGLRCFVVFDLKTGEFKPEFTGKMNFYLSAVDDLLRQPTDQPTIGIILCRERNEITVEYALRATNRPIGVSRYRITEALPEPLQLSLPTQQELQALVQSLQEKLVQTTQELSEFQCPVCGAPLVTRNAIPMSESDTGAFEAYACGHETVDGVTDRPCPSSPLFPQFDEYEVRLVESAQGDDRLWISFANPKTRNARRVDLGREFGKTQDEARSRLFERHQRAARRWTVAGS